MRRITIAAAGLAVMSAVPFAHAQDDGMTLEDAVSAFVAEEVEGATPERQSAITTCIVSAFDRLDEEEIAGYLENEDFEDSLGQLMEAHPEREAIIESCEEL